MTKLTKRNLLLAVLIMSALILFSFFSVFNMINAIHAFAQNDTESEYTTSEYTEIAGETDKANLGYTWLSGKVGDWKSLSAEETAFSLLALSYDDKDATKGKAALLEKSKSSEGVCWPGIACKVKETALAMLALERLNQPTKKIQKWLIARNKTFITQLDWYMQAVYDGTEKTETNCTISYSGKADNVAVGKTTLKLTEGASSCLSLSPEQWLRIDKTQSCLGQTYGITCDDPISVTLLYVKDNILYVPSKTETGDSVDVKIETICLADEDKNECDYEGTMWAAYALDKAGADVELIKPYLVSQSIFEERYLPEAFLYKITAEDVYADSLLEKQNKYGYWLATQKIYDTALALFSLKEEDSYYFGSDENVTLAKKYLLEHQESDGSWENNIKNTAFVLYSLWPKSVSMQAITTNVCEDEGYSCKTACADNEEEAATYNRGCDTGKKCCREKTIVSVCQVIADCAGLSCDNAWVESSTCQCEYGKETNCIDNCDNDYDLLVDAEDSDCQVSECERNNYVCCMECKGEEQEQYSDSCSANYLCCDSCRELTAEVCDDKIDNDDDTLIDCKDSDCNDFSKCKSKWWLWLLIFVLLAGGAAAFFYLKKKKIKFSDLFSRKKQEFGKKPLFMARFNRPATISPAGRQQAQPVQQPASSQPSRPSFMTRFARAPMPSRPSGTIRPMRFQKGALEQINKEKSETEKELEKTLKKLKDLEEK